MQDKILANHYNLGIITYKDLINDLTLLLDDYDTLLDNIINILKEKNIDDETITYLFSDSIDSRLDWIIYVLKGLL